jgi:predicted nucleotidyltransferase
MRLNNKEIESIKEVTSAVFGENATVRLFGSRTDDSKRGGDIDLFIQYNHANSAGVQYQLKIKFLVQLKKLIGDQKIDVLIDGGQQSGSIFKAVMKEGIQL